MQPSKVDEMKTSQYKYKLELLKNNSFVLSGALNYFDSFVAELSWETLN